MFRRRLLTGLFILTICFCFPRATRAQSWDEVGDAGELPGNAQVPMGSGPLTTVRGQLGFNNVDMFEILITGGGTFSATGQGTPPFYSPNTLLILFDSQGRGVYANDNIFPPDPFFGPGTSLLPANHPLTPLSPGRYFLAVTTYDYIPSSLGGAIFPCLGCTSSGVFGPTGPGGTLPVTTWSGFSFGGSGNYTITLTGARFPLSDSTPPVIVPTVEGTPGLGGWYTSDITVSWGVTDGESPITAHSGCLSSTVSTDTAGVTFTCTATSDGGTHSESVTVKRDATPPVVACSVAPGVLWPPNGRLISVATTVAVNDSTSGVAGFVLDRFAVSEGELASNVVDWTLATPDTAGFLRAERSGSGQGRSYALFYAATDNAGNTATCDVSVSVPHDQSK